MADEEILVFEYQEAFAYFDSDRDGKINTTEFAQVLRALGHAPTDGELLAMTKAIDRIYGGYLSFPNFVKVVSTIVESRIRPPAEHADAVTGSLVTFNRVCRQSDESTVSTSDLHALLTRHQDTLDETSFLALLKQIKPRFDGAGIPGNANSESVVGSGKVVFLPGPRGTHVSAVTRGRSRDGAQQVEIRHVVDRLLLAGKTNR